MHGHEHLIAMRRRGLRPAIVWLVDGQPPRPSRLDREYPQPDAIQVCAADSPALLDLRCVVGLQVHVMAQDSTRFDALCTACTEAGAARVLGSLHDPITSDVLRMVDTAGHFVLEEH